MRTGRSHPTNSSARDGEGRGPGRRRQVGPGTAGAAEPVGGRGLERSAGACWTSAGARAAAFPWRCPPWPAMRLPVPSLGVLLLLLLPPPPGEATKKPTPCKRCRELVDKFNQGMVDTANKNFGGGNTAWEEKTLSKYEFSEVRLLEILEGLCGSSDFECNQLVEEHEERLEAWWLRLKKKHPDLFEWFCVKTLEVCCPPGTYGPDCLACQGGSERPCSGNGHCSGDGSRQGDGSCQCHAGYQGPLCTDCVDGYFSLLRNATHSVCSACDQSCKTCTGPTHRDCEQCEVGWVQEDDACVGEPPAPHRGVCSLPCPDVGCEGDSDVPGHVSVATAWRQDLPTCSLVCGLLNVPPHHHRGLDSGLGRWPLNHCPCYQNLAFGVPLTAALPPIGWPWWSRWLCPGERPGTYAQACPWFRKRDRALVS
uniref:EGF-like domain-containing protein n=1 Tax=Sus scrofa TaxID=9823 RepID=A0A8D0UQ38_PIG